MDNHVHSEGQSHKTVNAAVFPSPFSGSFRNAGFISLWFKIMASTLTYFFTTRVHSAKPGLLKSDLPKPRYWSDWWVHWKKQKKGKKSWLILRISSGGIKHNRSLNMSSSKGCVDYTLANQQKHLFCCPKEKNQSMAVLSLHMSWYNLCDNSTEHHLCKCN